MPGQLAYPYTIDPVRSVLWKCGACGESQVIRLNLVRREPSSGHVGGTPMGVVEPRKVVVFVACPGCGVIALPPERMPSATTET